MQEENNIAKKIGGMGLAAVMAVGTVGMGVVPASADETGTTPNAGDSTTASEQKLKATYGSQTVTFTKNADGDYEATIDKYGNDPLKTVAATFDGSSNPITLNAKTKPQLNIDHSTVGKSHMTSTIVYEGSFDESSTVSHKVKLTVNVDETHGTEVKLENGTPFVVQGNTADANATLTGVTLDEDGNASQKTVKLSDKQEITLDWGNPCYSYDNGYTIIRDATGEGTVTTQDYNWETGKRDQTYEWNLKISATASNTASWATTYEGKNVEFKTDSGGTQVAEMTGTSIPKTLEVTGKNGKNVTLDNPTPIPNITASSDTVGKIQESGAMGYSKSKQDVLPAFAATVNFTKTYGKEVTLKDGTHFTVQADGKTATLDYANADYKVNKNKKVVDGNGNEVTELELSDGTKIPVTWTATTDAKTHVATVVGVSSKDYSITDKETGAQYTWTLKVNQSYTRTDTWTGTVDNLNFNFTNDTSTGDQSYTTTEPLGKIPGAITVHSNDSADTFKLTRSDDLKDLKVSANGSLGKVNVSGVAAYHTGAQGGHPAFDVSIPFKYTAGETVTLEGGTEFTVGGENSDGSVEAVASMTGEYSVTKDRKVVDKNGKEVKQLTLSNGDKINVAWNVSTDEATHTYTATGVATGNYTYTDKQSGQQKVWHLTVNLGDYVRTNKWYALVDGQKQDFVNQPNAGGKQTLTAKTLDKRPGKITIGSLNADDDTTLTVTPTFTDQHITAGDKLGTAIVSGTAVYHADANPASGLPQFDITVPFSYTTGSKITLKNGSDKDTEFVREGDTYQADYSSNGLSDKDNSPSYNEVTLSDDSKAKVEWNANTETKTVNDATIVFLNGKATGTVTVNDGYGNVMQQTYVVNTRNVRPEDKSFTKMTLTQTSADGKTKDYEIAKDDFDENRQKIVELDASDASDSFTLSAKHGLDAQVSRPKLSVDGTSRILTVNVNGEDYTVRVNFKTSDIMADSPAKLSGIYVNLTGKAEKGTLIDNWDPNRLDYVVALKDANANAYLLPEAPDGVTIKAGNVAQSAQSSRQEWIVTDTASGASRTYSVTVTRPVKTAVTEFVPKEPVEQSASVKPDSQSDTTLASVGYVDSNGKYVPVKSDTFEIPEGGTFSYEPKIGQSAVLSSSHKGMTYTYTVSVLSPDGMTFTQHSYKVTYITGTTHKDELMGIAVDGKLINGFDPNKDSYEVAVDNPDRWTVVAQYDKDSGMSITINKNGADATITVTSGDGLVSKDYHLHVTKKLFGGDGTVGVGGLAQTGVNTGIIGIIVIALAAIGGPLATVAVKLGKRKDKPETGDGQEDTGEDKPEDDPAPTPQAE